jgi:DNA modification methylase
VKHYHRNPRRITKKQFADLQDSLKRLGDLSGIVHDLTSDEIISGNQRMDVFDLKTAQIEITERLERPDEQGTVARGWVIWQGHRYTYRAVAWDEQTRAEANIRANKAGGSWDFDTLANEFEFDDLLAWGFDEAELTGLDFGDEDEQKEEPGEVEPSDDLTKKWGVAVGQLWQLGEHRLLVDDCTLAGTIARLMGGEKAGMVFTDPPYATLGSSSGKMEIGDFEIIKPFFREVRDRITENLKTGRAAFICCDWRTYPFLYPVISEKLSPKNLIVWYHHALKLGTGNFRPTYELVYYGLNLEVGSWTSKTSVKGWAVEDRSVSDVWEIRQAESAPTKNRLHVSQKPIELVEKAIGHCSKSGEIVLDLFLGSGTSMVAAERTGRKCYGCEKSVSYAATILERLFVATGIEPVRIEQ